MRIQVQFYSSLKDATGRTAVTEELPPGSRINDLLDALIRQFPDLEPWRKSTLAAVGVEYQDRNYSLQEGDQVALFPPVAGG